MPSEKSAEHLPALMIHSNLRICYCFNGRFSLKHNDTVSQIGGHDEIVLNNESSLLGMQNKPVPTDIMAGILKMFIHKYFT